MQVPDSEDNKKLNIYTVLVKPLTTCSLLFHKILTVYSGTPLFRTPGTNMSVLNTVMFSFQLWVSLHYKVQFETFVSVLNTGVSSIKGFTVQIFNFYCLHCLGLACMSFPLFKPGRIYSLTNIYTKYKSLIRSSLTSKGIIHTMVQHLEWRSLNTATSYKHTCNIYCVKHISVIKLLK